MPTSRKKTARMKAGLNKAAEELIRLAKEGGVEQNFFFQTTFDRYMVQLDTLDRLKKEIQDGELLITKEYVKGRQNLVANPAITEYNKTSTAANQTVQTLIKIITIFAEGTVMGSAEDDGEKL